MHCIRSTRCSFSHQFRHYCPTKLNSSETNVLEQTTKNRTVDTEVLRYLEEHNPSLVVNDVPKKYLMRTKNIKIVYLANPTVAGKTII